LRALVRPTSVYAIVDMGDIVIPAPERELASAGASPSAHGIAEPRPPLIALIPTVSLGLYNARRFGPKEEA